MPERIQMSRQHPWRADHPDAVIVSRPSKWGNPFKAGERLSVTSKGVPIGTTLVADASIAVFLFRRYVEHHELDLEPLRGKDLACWCPMVDSEGNRVPCHADVLLELANQPKPFLCPECVQGKHGNCIEQTLNDNDEWVPCGCPEHGGAR